VVFRLGDQLLRRFGFADDLLPCVEDLFHGEVPGPVWPDKVPHSRWTNFKKTHQFDGVPGGRFDHHLGLSTALEPLGFFWDPVITFPCTATASLDSRQCPTEFQALLISG